MLLWLPSSRHPFALCALAGSVCWLCACLCAATMRHALLRCAPPRSACPCGSHAQHRQVRDVAVRAHATFATTRPGVCPLPQASATAPLHWPLTTLSRAAVSPRIVSDIPTNSWLLRVDLNPLPVLFSEKDFKSNFRLSGNFVPVGQFFSGQPLNVLQIGSRKWGVGVKWLGGGRLGKMAARSDAARQTPPGHPGLQHTSFRPPSDATPSRYCRLSALPPYSSPARPAIGSKVTKTAGAGRGCVRRWSNRNMLEPWVSWWCLPRGVAPGSHLPQTAKQLPLHPHTTPTPHFFGLWSVYVPPSSLGPVGQSIVPGTISRGSLESS